MFDVGVVFRLVKFDEHAGRRIKKAQQYHWQGRNETQQQKQAPEPAKEAFTILSAIISTGTVVLLAAFICTSTSYALTVLSIAA
jgi:hypothetical protein